jgi:hypothetical protein
MQGKPYRVRQGTSERPRRHSIGRLKTASWTVLGLSKGALGLGVPRMARRRSNSPAAARAGAQICLRVHVRARFALHCSRLCAPCGARWRNAHHANFRNDPNEHIHGTKKSRFIMPGRHRSRDSVPIAGLSQAMSKPESMKAELRCILGAHDLTDSNRACPIAKGCLGQDAKAAKIPGRVCGMASLLSRSSGCRQFQSHMTSGLA